MFKVIKRFVDLKDNNHVYEVDSVFPRKGANVTQERINELSSNKNKQGVPLIVEVVEEQPEKIVEEQPKEVEEVQETKPKKKKK